MFNAARLVGPAIAGLLIASTGIAMCFFLNGVSFLAVIGGLAFMQTVPAQAPRLSSFADVRADLEEGFQYIRQSGPVLAVILLVGAVGTFGVNFNVVVPIEASVTLNVGAVGLGWLMSALGAGSLAASLMVAYQSKQPRPRLILVVAALFGLSEVILAPIQSYPASLLLLVAVGATQTAFAAQANSFVQLNVPDHLRGRVMSIYMMFWAGTVPFGNSLVGWAGETTGSLGPYLIGGIASLLAVVAVMPWLWRSVTATDAVRPLAN
jgi:predicted MFS family arabinose efflux permease